MTQDLGSVEAPRFVDGPTTEEAPGRLADWRAWGRSALAEYSESASADTDLLLAHILGCERSSLPARDHHAVDAVAALRLVGLVERRKQGEPVAYLTGHRGFWTLDLAVDSRVLVPRPDTETLVEWALEIVRALPQTDRRVADLGTGSGAVVLALAKECPGLTLFATDSSEEALEVAGDNARAVGANDVIFRKGDWFAALPGECFNLIVSNPPYIADNDPHLVELRFEPRAALVSGPLGLDALQMITGKASDHLLPGGWLLLEHGSTQAPSVRELLARAGFEDVRTRDDLGGLERVSGGRRPNS